jgi:hypothetical protein
VELKGEHPAKAGHLADGQVGVDDALHNGFI